MLPKNLKRRNLLKKVEIFRDFSHDNNSVPNFVPYQEKADFSPLFNPFVHDMEDLVVRYSSTKTLPKEFAGVKKDLDPEIEIPFN